MRLSLSSAVCKTIISRSLAPVAVCKLEAGSIRNISVSSDEDSMRVCIASMNGKYNLALML